MRSFYTVVLCKIVREKNRYLTLLAISKICGKNVRALDTSFHCSAIGLLKEEFEDTKGVIRIRNSKRGRQHNGQKYMTKTTNNDLQMITHITKDRAARTTLKTGDELMCSGRVSSSCSTRGNRRVTIPVISHELANDRKVFTTSGTYPWSFVTQMFRLRLSNFGDLKRKHKGQVYYEGKM